jgi:phosphonoacetaldehyde hydrolase
VSHVFTFQRQYRGGLQAVVLDWAGTTVDYGCYAPAVVFREVFKRQGIEISIEEAREPMGTHKKTHIEQITKIPAVSRRWKEAHGRDCNDHDVETMFADFIPLQLACLAEYADLIPGTLETIAEFRNRGLKIGSTTGYDAEMMAIVQKEARQRGYEPDSMVCGTDVPAGRPAPWMCLVNAQQLGIFPMESIVKIGDTVPDIAEGLNAGMWTIGLAKTGNEIGLNEAEISALPEPEYDRRIQRAYTKMNQAGAHYVVDGIADVLPCLDAIETRLQRGEKP